MKNPRTIIIAGLMLSLVVLALPSTGASRIFGDVVTIEQLSFHPDALTVPATISPFWWCRTGKTHRFSTR